MSPHTRAYQNGVVVAEGFPLCDVSDWLAQPDTVVWADFCPPNKAELHELADELGLHELAVEDALSDHQRPKLDHYESHLFLSCHAVRPDPDTGTLIETEVNAFVNHRWIITVRKADDFPLEPLLQRWDRSRDLAKFGVGFLLYGLIDIVVDRYFDTIGYFDDYYEDVSDQLFSDHPLEPSRQRHWFEVRRSLVRFHRLVVPMREAIGALMRREHDVIDERLYPYYQDVYDHLLRVTESTDALRDLVATIVETNLSLRDYRQNLIMKMVTSWAAIIAVPTLITGWYGMNVPFPGSGETWGVFVAAGLVIAMSLGLFLLFRRRGWL